MYDRILVPMALDHDVSPQTLKAAQTLLNEGGEIVALHVYETPPGSVSVYLDEDSVRSGFEAAQKRLLDKLRTLDGIRPVVLKGHTARTIIDYAAGNAMDCIVIGSHRPGLSDYLLGSTAGRVVRHAPCSVHVQRAPN